MLKLPNDCWAIIAESLALADVLVTSQTCKNLHFDMRSVLGDMPNLKEEISADGLDFVIKNCHLLASPPVVTTTRTKTATKVDLRMLRKLQTRWPQFLTLNWNLSSANTITHFLNNLRPANFRTIKYFTLIATPTLFSTPSLPYMDLQHLAIYCNHITVESVMTKLRIRDWDVEDLFLQGDIFSGIDVVMHLPSVSQHLAILNTAMQTSCCLSGLSLNGTEEVARFLANQNLQTVALCGVFPLCCEACPLSHDFCRGIYTALLCAPGQFWHTDLCTADMIEGLLRRGCKIATSVFHAEKEIIKNLAEQFPDHLIVHAYV